ncbi:hypothetical protein HZA56_02555 [Candidatus Poribacteria bacterium]|nr:hypothetical protein [Candidatus Poribacteria bacterium]
MPKNSVAAMLALVMLLTALVSPCIAAPIASSTGAEEGGKVATQPTVSSPSATPAETQEMDETVVGELVQGITNTQLVVGGLVVILLVAVIVAAS